MMNWKSNKFKIIHWNHDFLQEKQKLNPGFKTNRFVTIFCSFIILKCKSSGIGLIFLFVWWSNISFRLTLSGLEILIRLVEILQYGQIKFAVLLDTIIGGSLIPLRSMSISRSVKSSDIELNYK